MRENESIGQNGGVTIFQMIGEIVWLLGQLRGYRNLFIADLDWLIIPPLLSKQFLLFREDGKPIGLALWAFLDAETEERYEAESGRLKPDEWSKGDRCWIVELVDGKVGQERILASLHEGALREYDIKMHIMDESGRRKTSVMKKRDHRND